MRIYLEATETVGMGEVADFIRADVTDKTDAKVEEIKGLIQDIMAGLDYRLAKHLCNHNTGGSCVSEEI